MDETEHPHRVSPGAHSRRRPSPRAARRASHSPGPPRNERSQLDDRNRACRVTHSERSRQRGRLGDRGHERPQRAARELDRSNRLGRSRTEPAPRIQPSPRAPWVRSGCSRGSPASPAGLSPHELCPARPLARPPDAGAPRRVRGRGAAENPASRFEPLHYEANAEALEHEWMCSEAPSGGEPRADRNPRRESDLSGLRTRTFRRRVENHPADEPEPGHRLRGQRQPLPRLRARLRLLLCEADARVPGLLGRARFRDRRSS